MEKDFHGEWILRNGMKATIGDKIGDEWRGRIIDLNQPHHWDKNGNSYKPDYDLCERRRSLEQKW